MPTSPEHHNFSRAAQSSAADENHHHPRTVEELTHQNIETIIQLESAAKSQRRQADRIADIISDFCGTMTFVYVHIGAFSFWSAFNLLAPKHLQFDPFPFFFLSFIVALEAIFLSTFILISQNHEKRLSERRNHLDLQVNLLSEQENTKMLHLLKAIAQKLEVPFEDDPSGNILEEAMRPEQLIEQIDQAVAEIERRGGAEEKANNSNGA